MRYAIACLLILAPATAIADDCGLAAQYRALAAQAPSTDAEIVQFITDFAAVNALPSTLTDHYRMPGTAMVANISDKIAYMQRTARGRADALCKADTK